MINDKKTTIWAGSTISYPVLCLNIFTNSSDIQIKTTFSYQIKELLRTQAKLKPKIKCQCQSNDGNR